MSTVAKKLRHLSDTELVTVRRAVSEELYRRTRPLTPDNASAKTVIRGQLLAAASG